jgi:hypothetical protein
MYFSYSPFSPTSSASSSASSSPNRSPSTSCHATSSYATTSYASTSTSPISITNPCAYPSWPSRSSLNTPSSSDPYALTTASSYLSDDDLFPSPSDDSSSSDSTPLASPKLSARQVLDTGAIRELLLEEGRRKARKGAGGKVVVKGRRRGSANAEKRGSAKLSPIAEGSGVE